MSNLWYPRKESPLLGLTGMGGGVGALMWAGATSVGPFDLWCCGENEYGALGQNQSEGALSRRSSPVQIPGNWIQLAAPGYSSTFGIKGDKVGEGGTLWAWGQNNSGNLGLNEGGYPGPWKSSPTQVGSYDDWVYVSSTAYQSFGVRSPGALYAWGRNFDGYALGLNDNAHRSSPTQIPGTWRADAYSVRATGNGGMAISSSNALYTWGNNQQGQLMQNTSGLSPGVPDGSPTPQLVPGNWKGLMGGGGVNFVFDTSDQLWACGTGGKGTSPNSRVSSPVQLPGTWVTNAGKSDTEQRLLNYVGNDHKLALYNESVPANYLKAWGYNSQGQLGTRNTTAYQDSVAYVYPYFGNVVSVAANGTSSAVVKTDGTLWGWGSDFGKFAVPGMNYGSPNQVETRSAPIQIGTHTDWYSVNMAKGTWYGLREQA